MLLNDCLERNRDTLSCQDLAGLVQLDPAMRLMTNNIVQTLHKKACKSSCTYKVSAVAFDKRGDVLGTAFNMHSSWNVLDFDTLGRAGTAKHPERLLIKRYGKHVKTILICRVGKGGDLRPIDPCPACRKAASKLGIKIISIPLDSLDSFQES